MTVGSTEHRWKSIDKWNCFIYYEQNTIKTNKKTKVGIIVAIIKGTIIENIIEILQKIPLKQWK